MKMTSTRPYLIRAFYDWLIDNHMTPYLLVNANYPGVVVPTEHIQNGQIVLNISPQACRGLHLENDRIVFTTRFAGKILQVFLPPAAVMAIYSKENGKGMEFAEEDPPEMIAAETYPAATASRPKKPKLTLVKKNEDE